MIMLKLVGNLMDHNEPIFLILYFEIKFNAYVKQFLL